MKYQVKVDGKVFEVEVEKVGGGYGSLTPGSLTAAPAAAPVAPVAPAAAPVQAAPAPQQAAPAPAAAPAAGGAGDVILILEAMKMENEIVAPCAGKVTLKVTAGETVDTDALLAVVE